MTTNKTINRGSEWRKWDLHFHTPSSYDYKDKSVTNQKIIDILAENKISVVAITDHHTMDIARIQELQLLGKDKGITVLPGIEFLADARGKDPIHFIGIFSDTSNISYIWGQLKNTTNIKQIEGSNKKHNEVYCDLIDTMKLIKELGGITTIHAGSKTNNIENITNSLPHAIAQKEDIVDLVDIYELGKVTDKEGYIKNVFPNIGKYIPMIIASDNHDIKNYSLKENCWIKADPTFEGLKQIIYEPEERVRIQEEEPDFKEDKEIIDKVKFISLNNKFSNEEIYLNPNLNVIIGGKSSGKSILLYSIAKTLLADTKDKLLFKNNGEERYSLKSIDYGFDFEITTKAGISQKISDREDGHNSLIPNIKYIPQNELVKLAEPELSGKGESLNKLVRNLICEDTDSKQKYDDFIKNVKQYDKEREELINSYFETLDNIQKLEAELKTKSNKEVLQTNIKTNSEKVEELNKKAGLSDEQIQQYKSIQEQQQENQKRRDLLNSDFSQTNAFLQELNKELSNLQERKNTFLQSIHKNEFRGYYQDKLKFIDDSIVQLQGLISEIGTIINSEGKRIFNTDNIFKEELKQINYEKSNIEEELKPYQQNEDIKKQIRTLEEFIENDGKLLSEIDSLNKKIEEKRQSIEEIKTKLFDLYKNSYNEYIDIVEQLKNRTIELEKDGLQIRGVTQFNFPKFRREIISFTHGTYNDNDKYCILDENRSRIFETNYDELISNISKMFNEIMTSEYRIKTISKKEAVKKLLNDYFYDYWEITYKNDKLGEMSTGKASFVILMLIIGLSKSKSPILIDQPEDNLDNRSVSENIISYLRNKKIERQIILVTHNANIVVNADAENVIVANQKGQNDKETSSIYKFDYINGAIENTFAKIEAEKDLLKSMGIKEHIADIVEGGKEAFKNREKKYGFN
ncbi:MULTISPECIES: TrlF family AAA-like ATPase [Capnocytophaga]|uniref:TrlF family AAA-like ATPase n=1 Tax=Capnocytophaga TaxID=1016 RepID=UPI00020C85AF|nr:MULTISPECIES: hypothetical protein [unclassified Capnocytophaga]KHE69435.1 hypothetical protein HMPREF9074_08450 [Capnocytophaga sp. oral taxon 329 str. F0087]